MDAKKRCRNTRLTQNVASADATSGELGYFYTRSDRMFYDGQRRICAKKLLLLYTSRDRTTCNAARDP